MAEEISNRPEITNGIIEKNRKTFSKCNISIYKGLFCAFLCSLIYSFSSVIVKYVYYIDAGEMATIRLVGIMTFTLPFMVFSREKTFGPRTSRHVLIIHGILDGIKSYLGFFAYQNLPFAEASAIVFSSPAFVPVFARIFLKEPCRIFYIVNVFICLVGIVLLSKLPIINIDAINNNPFYYHGIAAAVVSALCDAVTIIVLRKLTDINEFVVLFNFSWIGTIISVIITLLNGKFGTADCGIDKWLLLLVGICGFASKLCITLALKLEEANPVAIIRCGSEIILAFIWQICFFNETADIYTVLGALLICSSALLLNIQKWVLSLPENTNIREKALLLTV